MTIHLFLLLMVLLPDLAETQTGKGLIVGSILNYVSGKPLTGAMISLRSTARGAITSSHGSFAIHDVTEGTYEVGISFSGFRSCILRNVRIRTDSVTQINVSLKPILGPGDTTIVILSEPEYNIPRLKGDSSLRFGMPHIRGDSTRQYKMPIYKPRRPSHAETDSANVKNR